MVTAETGGELRRNRKVRAFARRDIHLPASAAFATMIQTNMTARLPLYLALAFGAAPLLSGAIIGTNLPSQGVTADRIATLPADHQAAWKKYLARSEQQLQADQTFLYQEMKQHGVKETVMPPGSRSGSRLPLDKPAAWYGEAEARRIADLVISFQTPAGGWSKSVDMTDHRRAPGERFARDNASKHLGTFDNDVPRDVNWNYVGTFDNNATITQLRYLAKVISALGPDRATPYRAAFLRGLDYIFAAQFPNGGWPQVWPLQGGYHDDITYNDGAMINVLTLLSDVAAGQNDFAFVPANVRTQAAARVQRGLECVLETQLVGAGRRTVWCQQYDALTLQPAAARNYEMPSQCGSESAGLALFLMRQAQPASRTVAAVHAAAAWFEKTKLSGVAYKPVGDEGRQLVPTPDAGPLWARYYELGTDRPIFGDRDKTIHDDVNELSKERRNGYSWFNETPGRVLEQYARWSEAHPATNPPRK
jgi:PelA/Pel-15E family pectate lyase